MNRSDPVGLVVALLVVTATLSVVPALSGGAGAPETLATQGEFDQTEFRITVHEDGSARWTFRYKQTLANDTERQEFRAFASDFNENETELYRNFQTRAESLVASGRNETGREMTASAFEKRAYVTGLNDNLGVVEMSFRWSAFGVTEGNRVTIGDVFEGGLYIGSNQILVVTHGDGLVITDFHPTPDDRSDDTLTYRGERSFADNRPQVSFAPPGAATATGTSPSTPDSPATTTGNGPGGGGGVGMLPVVALLVVLGLGGGAAYAYRSGMLGGDAATAAGGDDGPDGGDGAAAVTDGAATAEPAISDEELLSDDDRVLKMLDERGGRMKQVNIVEETGWSKSKVSMLLSDMEEEGEISKLRVGRENIVSIAGQEPEAAGSPFKDDDE